MSLPVIENLQKLTRIPRDEICLYTMTPDSVVRIFMPVIDAPNHLQLHAAIDWRSFTSATPQGTMEQQFSKSKTSPHPVFWLERSTFLPHSSTIEDDVSLNASESEVERGRRRRLQDFAEEDWELFGFVTKQGSLVVRALTVSLKRFF